MNINTIAAHTRAFPGSLSLSTRMMTATLAAN